MMELKQMGTIRYDIGIGVRYCRKSDIGLTAMLRSLYSSWQLALDNPNPLRQNH